MPSIYIPHKTETFLARSKPLNDGLEELCLLQIGRPLTQDDIAEYCGVSQNLVHRIEKRAMKKLRAGLAELGIRPNGRFRGVDTRGIMRSGGL